MKRKVVAIHFLPKKIVAYFLIFKVVNYVLCYSTSTQEVTNLQF